tara:strand:- start:1 stop:159 length:159 start_codon:yes stop_codon:yes gene_type:complete
MDELKIKQLIKAYKIEEMKGTKKSVRNLIIGISLVVLALTALVVMNGMVTRV